MSRELDREIVQALAMQHLAILKEHYRNNQVSRDRVRENLSALAVAVAACVAGLPDAQEFFELALKNQVDLMLKTAEANGRPLIVKNGMVP